jgi:hypothetical protein
MHLFPAAKISFTVNRRISVLSQKGLDHRVGQPYPPYFRRRVPIYQSDRGFDGDCDLRSMPVSGDKPFSVYIDIGCCVGNEKNCRSVALPP